MFLKFKKNDVLLVMLLSLMKFGVGFIGGMVIPIFPSLIRMYSNISIELNNGNISYVNETKYNYHQLSILFVTKNLCQIIASPIVGNLVDLCGAMIILLAATLFQFLTLLVYGFGNVYYLLIFGRIFEAISTAIVNCAGAAWVAFRFKDHSQRGFVYGVKALSYCVGSAIGPAYGGVIYEYYGKLVVFLSFLSFVFAEFVLVLLVLYFERKSSMADLANSYPCLTAEVANDKELTIPMIEIMTPPITENNNKNCVDNVFLEEKSENKPETIRKLPKAKKKNDLIQSINFFKDSYFLISIGTFPMIFISIYLLNSSLSRYMVLRFNASESQQGVIWIVNLLGYALGFVSGNIINTKLSKFRHIILTIYIGLHALSVISIPFMPVWWSVSVPLCIIVHVHLVVEVVLSPLLATIVETRHQSKFGAMSGIILMSTSITGSLGSFLGPILLSTIGFMNMNIGVSTLSVFYAPLYLFLGKFNR